MAVPETQLSEDAKVGVFVVVAFLALVGSMALHALGYAQGQRDEMLRQERRAEVLGQALGLH